MKRQFDLGRASLLGIGATLSVVFTIPLHSSFERGDGRVALAQRGTKYSAEGGSGQK